VLLDGVDLKRLDGRSLRDTIGLVGHKPSLFAGGHYTHPITVSDNIAFGMSPAPPQRKIETAAKLAAAHCYSAKAKVEKSSLSRGHDACIALARAVIKNPSVLVLDEVASTLKDSDRLAAVEEAIGKVLGSMKRTTIHIGHHLSAARQADKIFVLRKGCVIEQSTHDELQAMGGAYAKLL
jgi:ABC-type multidrug transport system fused ATPase/permease subunit